MVVGHHTTVLDGVLRRLLICRTIWPYMLAMALTYMVTLSLYPGVETLLTSCSLGSWTSLVLMSVFNVTDLLGKMAASRPGIQALSSLSLVLVPMARLLLVPLTLLAAARYRPILKSFILSSLLFCNYRPPHQKLEHNVSSKLPAESHQNQTELAVPD